MRHSRLVLISALWLTLSGAAPQPAISTQGLAECRATRDEALAALPGLGVEEANETALDGGKRTIRTHVKPAGFTVFGLAPHTFRSVETIQGDKNRTLFMTIFKLPYPTVEAAVLKGHGFAACPEVVKSATTSGGNCAVFIRENQGYATVLMIQQYDDDVGIGCNYIGK